MSNELLREKIHRMEAGRLWSGGGRSHEPPASPFTKKIYAWCVSQAKWEMARSSFYYQRGIAAQPDRFCNARTQDRLSATAGVLEKIREVLAASPILRRGPSQVSGAARAFRKLRTSKARVLRLIREAQLLAPSRALPKTENPHTGTIITARPNEVWASDHTTDRPRSRIGAVTVFVAVAITAPRNAWACMWPRRPRVRGAGTSAASKVRDYCGTASAPARRRVSANRHDHGSQYMSDDYQAESHSSVWSLRHRSCANRNATAASNGSFARSRAVLWVKAVSERRGDALRAGGIS